MSCSVAISSSPVFSPSPRFGHQSCFKPSPELLPLSPSLLESRLKRKRPARIDVPTAEEASRFATKLALRSDGMEEVEVEGLKFSVYCKRGKKRLQMEDRHCAEFELGGSEVAFFGIFDGHGGKAASEFASEKMASFVGEELMKGGGNGEVEEAVKIGYLRTDSEFLKEGKGGGACCVTALVSKGNVVVSNVGDCRAVLSRAGKYVALTSDHRLSREDERKRIESNGGYVDYIRGAWRLQGSLAVSRTIGDSHFKQWAIPEPETKIITLEEDTEFLILASDGLWDKVGNQEAVDIARQLCIKCNNPSPMIACKKLVDLAAARGSVDDTSVMIVQLQQFL